MPPTDTTQAIDTHTTSQVARNCAIGAGVLGAFLTGLLVATAAGGYGVGLTLVGWDLARAGAISCAIIAMLAGLTWWGVDQVVRRLDAAADRNRNATLAMVHRLDELERALPKLIERARWDGYADAVEDLNANQDRVVHINTARG